MLRRFFKYMEPMWLGVDGKISLRAVGFIALLIDFISNMSHAVYKWDEHRSLEGLSYLLVTEAGFATTLLGIAAWSNISNKKLDNEATSPTKQNSSPIRVENVETMNTAQTENKKTDGPPIEPLPET